MGRAAAAASMWSWPTASRATSPTAYHSPEPFPRVIPWRWSSTSRSCGSTARLVARVSGHTPGNGGCAVSLTEESGFRARVELLDVVASSVEVLLSDVALALRPRSVELPSPLAHRLRPGEAQLALKIALESRVPTAAEVDLSVAPGVEALFTRAAALHTPLLLPSPTAAAPAFARGLFLLELADVQEADRLHFATHTRITGTRRVQLTGDESLHYRLVVRAEVPIR